MEENKENEGLSVVEEIIQVLDRVRPFIQRDGGDIKFVKFEDGYVYVRVAGACVGCAAIDSTLQDGVEAILKDEIPEVVGVINADLYEQELQEYNDLEEN